MYQEIGPLRWPADAQTGIAARDKPFSQRMENFVEHGIANFMRPGSLDERQGYPLAEKRDMPRTVHEYSGIGHGLDVGRDPGRLVVCAGAVRSSHQDPQRRVF